MRLEHEEVALPESAILVRWRRPVTDATPFLAVLAESRRFYDGRSKFVHEHLPRTTAYQQHLLDRTPGDVAVVVPPALTGQWHRELAKKFRLDEQFPGRVRIISSDDTDDLPHADSLGLLVVD